MIDMKYWNYQVLNLDSGIVVDSWLSRMFSAHRPQLLVIKCPHKDCSSPPLSSKDEQWSVHMNKSHCDSPLCGEWLRYKVARLVPLSGSKLIVIQPNATSHRQHRILLLKHLT